MTYIKADVPEDVHTKMRVQAAEKDVPIEEVARQQLIEAFEE